MSPPRLPCVQRLNVQYMETSESPVDGSLIKNDSALLTNVVGQPPEQRRTEWCPFFLQWWDWMFVKNDFLVFVDFESFKR